MRGKYQKKYWLYRNHRNSHKFLALKRHHDGHYSFLQFIQYDNGVINYIGCRLNHHHYNRVHKQTILEVLQEYELLSAWWTM